LIVNKLLRSISSAKLWSIILFLTFVVSLFPTSAALAEEASLIDWTRQFGTSGGERAEAVTADTTGVYVVGFTGGALPGQTYLGSLDAFVRKYNGDGSENWTHQFGTTVEDFAMGVAVDSTGIYVAGYVDSALPGQTSVGGRDAFIRKYNFDSTENWTHQFGTGWRDDARGITADSTGIYVTGFVSNGALPGQTNFGSSDAFVRRYHSSGTILWTRQFGTDSSDEGHGISVDSTGVYVSGVTNGVFPGESDNVTYDAFVRKYSLDGTELWTRQFGTTGTDFAWGVASHETLGVYVTGETGYNQALPGQTSAGRQDVFVRKYNTDGTENWTRQFGSTGSSSTGYADYGRDVSVDNTGVYVTGEIGRGGFGATLPGQSNKGSSDAFVRKYDPDGTELWTHQFGTSTVDNAYGIFAGTSGLYVSGYTGGTFPGQSNAGSSDNFLIKFVSANDAPVADPDGPYSGTVGTPVSFDGSGSVDPDGTIVSYDWDFGDSNSGTSVSPTHSYASPGMYTVSLTTVTDNHGLTDTANTTSVITEINFPPVANPNGPYSGTVGIPIFFDGSGSVDPDGTIVSYDWDFGDGTLAMVEQEQVLIQHTPMELRGITP
jgi:PKD repeat protein